MFGRFKEEENAAAQKVGAFKQEPKKYFYRAALKEEKGTAALERSHRPRR